MSNNYTVKGERTKTRTLKEAVEQLKKHDELLPDVDFDTACEVVAAIFNVPVTDLKNTVMKNNR